MATKINAGMVAKDMWVRLANRKGTLLTPAYVKVTEVEPADLPNGQPGYKVLTEAGEYGHFSAAAKFELGSEPVVKEPKPAPEKKEKVPAGPRVSVPMRNALRALAAQENGDLTRADLAKQLGHIDPMTVKGMVERKWVTVDRHEKDRQADLVELTTDGLEVARKLGLATVAVAQAG